MRSTQARSRCTTGAYIALFVACLALALTVVVMANAPRSDPDAVVRPIESFDSDDLRDAVRELRRLRGARLTPEERRAVGIASEALGSLVEGDAVIAPATTVPSGDAAPPPPTPAPSTTTTTTTTVPPTTTTRPPPGPPTPVRDFLDAIQDQLP